MGLDTEQKGRSHVVESKDRRAERRAAWFSIIPEEKVLWRTPTLSREPCPHIMHALSWGSLKKRSNPGGMPARILVIEGWTQMLEMDHKEEPQSSLQDSQNCYSVSNAP